MDQFDGGGGEGRGAGGTLGNLPSSGPLPPHLVVKQEQGKTTHPMYLVTAPNSNSVKLFPFYLLMIFNHFVLNNKTDYLNYIQYMCGSNLDKWKGTCLGHMRWYS